MKYDIIYMEKGPLTEADDPIEYFEIQIMIPKPESCGKV